MVRHKADEVESKYLDINEHWQQHRTYLEYQKVRADIRKHGGGMRRLLERENSSEEWKEYKKSKQNAKKVISSAKEKKAVKHVN